MPVAAGGHAAKHNGLALVKENHEDRSDRGWVRLPRGARDFTQALGRSVVRNLAGQGDRISAGGRGTPGAATIG